MTKQELIRNLSLDVGTSQDNMLIMLDALKAVIEGELIKGNEITLPGIGKLVPVEKPARTGRNPATGEALQIPASRGIKFRVAKPLKDALA